MIHGIAPRMPSRRRCILLLFMFALVAVFGCRRAPCPEPDPWAVLRLESPPALHAGPERAAFEAAMERIRSALVQPTGSPPARGSSAAPQTEALYLVVPPHPAVKVEPPVDWIADPFEDRSWRYQLNAWGFLAPNVDYLTGKMDRDVVRFARRIALDWGHSNRSDSAENPFAWYDMAVGQRARILGPVTRASLQDSTVSHDDAWRLLQLTARHIEALTEEEKIAWHSNHGCFQVMGLLTVLDALPAWPGEPTYRSFGMEALRRIMEVQFTPEGVHREHSPFYAFWMTQVAAMVLHRNWLADPACKRAAGLALQNAAWYLHPNGTIARLGDTDLRYIDALAPYHFSAATRYVFSEGREGRVPEGNSRVFAESGWAIFRSPWEHRPWRDASYCFFSAAFHSRMHRHADDLTFEWSAGGMPIVIDAGRYAYHYDSAERQYVISTRAHNTVEIDGGDYSSQRRDAFGSAITGSASAGQLRAVEACIERDTGALRQRRVVVFSPDGWLGVLDCLDAESDHHYTQWFHFHPSIHMKRDGRCFRGDMPGHGKMVRLLRAGAGEGAVAHVRGQREPRLQGWTSFNPLSFVPNDAVGFHANGSNVVLAALLSAGAEHALPSQLSLQVDGDRMAVRWRCPAGSRGYTVEGTGQGLRLLAFP